MHKKQMHPPHHLVTNARIVQPRPRVELGHGFLIPTPRAYRATVNTTDIMHQACLRNPMQQMLPLVEPEDGPPKVGFTHQPPRPLLQKRPNHAPKILVHQFE